MACQIHGKEWLEKYGDDAWDSMYRNWEHLNASYDAGYYAHYYIQD